MKKVFLSVFLIIVIILSSCRQTGSSIAKNSSKDITSNSALTSDVRMLNGVPALYVNGNLTGQILAAPFRPDESYFRDFLNAGINIFDIYLKFDWTGPEEYDFSKIDQKLDSYLAIAPDVLFLPRILLTPGAWWCEQFPNDITMRDDGTPAGMFGSKCHPSLASEKYRELSYKAMVAFLKHVEGKYGKNILGYQPGNGFGGEWLMFNSFWEARPGKPGPTKFGVEDYSPVAREAFRKWLKKSYGSVSKLRKAWNDKGVTFETATPPDEKERYTSNHGIFFDPAAGRRVTDYFSFFNDMTADVLLENCRWVKELTGDKKIVGVFYGYLWCNFPNLSVNHTGHLGFQRVLNSTDIDFIASPYTYDNKQIGGPNNSQTLPENALMHGKLYLNEVDTETHLFQRQWRWGNCLNNPKNWEETKGLLIRDYGYSMTKGFGLWWTDLHGGTFQDSSIIDLLGKLKKIDDQYLNADKRSNADIAVILDEETFKYFGDGEPLFNALLTAQKQWQLGFIGAPWEPYLLTDIANPALKDFKVYVFLNTFRVTDKQKKEIHKKLEKNGATAIWVYAPGYIQDNGLSVKKMSELTGISLKEDNSSGELRVGITNFDHAYTKGLRSGFVYGTDVDRDSIIRYYDHQIYLKDPRDPSLATDLPGFNISPRFYSDDAQATVLGNLAGVEKPGLVVKKQPTGWTSVYSSAPILPAALLRNIIRQAGGHIYSNSNDVISANTSSLSIYSPNGGMRTIKLPKKLKVTDLLENRVLADGAIEFPVTMEKNGSKLFLLESPTAKRDSDIFISHYSDKEATMTADPGADFWSGIEPLVIDRNILGGPEPEIKSEARSRWTKENIYFLFSGPFESQVLKPDPDTKKETFRLWQWDDFELYIGADFEHINLYREFEVSPQSEFLDLNINSEVAMAGHNDERLWDSGFTVKAKVDKVNKVWYAELCIPLASFDKREPKAGNEFRVNIYRLQGPQDNRDFLAWRPTGFFNPHHPEVFGILRLGN